MKMEIKENLTASEGGQYDDKFYTEDGNLLGVVRYNGKAIESVKCAKKKLSDKEAKEIREKFYNGKAIESVKCAKKKLSDKEAKEIREKFRQLTLENRKSSEQQDEHEFIAKHCK